MDGARQHNIILLLSLLILPPFICFGFDLPHAEVLTIFLSIIGLWISEALPLPVTGLLVPVLAVLYGALPATKAFDSFGSDILFLFLGCFLMGRSMEKHGFDKRLAYFLLGRCMPGSSFFSVNLIIALASFTLSMWISNTSATAIMCAVTIGVLTSLESQVTDNEMRHRMAVRLLLSTAFAASIGGLATPIGSPPNLIALKLLTQNGVSISFLEWMMIGLPISLAMLAIMLLVFEFCFSLRRLSFPGVQEYFRKALKDLGPMSSGEKQIAAIFSCAIFLWIVPSILQTVMPDSVLIAELNKRISMSVVGLIGGLATFLLPVRGADGITANLTWSETDKVEWGTLMLFGGGLTLGLLLESSGTAKDLSAYLFQGEISSALIIGSIVVILSILMSEFASNTAAASILIPLILGATLARGMPSDVATNIVLAATFGASFGFMLPVSTPPNAIVYGTGRVPARDMRRAGIYFDILGALLIIIFLLVLH